MPAGYVIAILLCLGDNCDLVRPEPAISYPSYETCSDAAAKNASKLGEIAARSREAGREGEIICLREQVSIVELDEEHDALAVTTIHQLPSATSPVLGTLKRGQKIHVTGAVSGAHWMRVAMPEGVSGYVYGERLRKLAVSDAPMPAQGAAGGREPAPGSSGKTVPHPAPAAAEGARASQPAPKDQLAVATPPPAANAPPPAAPAPTAREFRNCEQCPAMVALPGGQFEMGSLADASERPVHRVQLAAFALGKYELTHGEWKACVAAGACSDKPHVGAGSDQLPMLNLSWDDAAQYVQWLRGLTGKPYRLPSEAEWEYAARAGTTTPYPWGKEIGVARANCSGCGGNYDPKLPAAVGSFPPNAWGLYDMLGGVAEWTEDCWHKNYEGAPANGSAWQTARCREHVLRGGSWKNPPTDLTVTSRNFYDATVRYIANGLRVAVTLP